VLRRMQAISEMYRGHPALAPQALVFTGCRRPSMMDKNGRRVPFFGVTFLRASKKGDTRFNIEVQHLGQQKENCYPKCLWEPAIII